jgi:hypothetical protein
VSSLFPQLAGASRSAYRVAFGLIVLLLVGLAVGGLTAPVIAVSALAIPLLFLIYLYEIAPRAARFAVPTAVIFLAGAALGACLGAAARAGRRRLAGHPGDQRPAGDGGRRPGSARAGGCAAAPG